MSIMIMTVTQCHCRWSFDKYFKSSKAPLGSLHVCKKDASDFGSGIQPFLTNPPVKCLAGFLNLANFSKTAVHVDYVRLKVIKLMLMFESTHGSKHAIKV